MQANQILSMLMGQAQANRRRGGGAEKEDPITKENRAATRKMIEGLVMTNNKEEFNAVAPYAESQGINTEAYKAVMRIETKQEKRKKAIGNWVDTNVMPFLSGLGGEQGKAPSSSSAPLPSVAQAPTQQGGTEWKNLSINPQTGDITSLSLGPKAKTEIQKLLEEGVITQQEAKIFLERKRKKVLGETVSNLRSVKNDITGDTHIIGYNDEGKKLTEDVIHSDYSGAEKRKQALELKQAGSKMRRNEETGGDELVRFGPNGPEVIKIPGKVGQTIEEKSTEATKQKLTQNYIGTDKDGNLFLLPIRGGEMGEAQIGPKMKEKTSQLKEITAEERQKLTNQRNIADQTKKVKEYIAEELGKEGYTIDDLTGPITGRLQTVYAKLFDNPTFERLRTDIRKLMTVVYGLSGKQLNQWELSWLSDDILPDIKQPTGNFLARLDAFEEWIKMQRVNEAASIIESGKPAVASGDIRDEVEQLFREKGSLTVNPPNVEELVKGKGKIDQDLIDKYPFLGE